MRLQQANVSFALSAQKKNLVTSPSSWRCETIDTVAFPSSIITARRLDTCDEIGLSAPLTPGAKYALLANAQNGRPIALEFVGYETDALRRDRLDLWRHLPEVNRRMDTTGDLRRFVGCLQDCLDLLVMRVERMPLASDSRTASAQALSQILADQGNPFSFALPNDDGRRLSNVLVEIYRQKGTERGIINAIRHFMGLQVEQIRCHIVTKDDGGFIVGGASRASLYAFDVIFPHPLSNEERVRVRAITEYLKPAHTHLVDILP